jgi:hypothetical protein
MMRLRIYRMCHGSLSPDGNNTVSFSEEVKRASYAGNISWLVLLFHSNDRGS